MYAQLNLIKTCSRRIYILRMLCSQRLSLNQLELCFHDLVVLFTSYALHVWSDFLATDEYMLKLTLFVAVNVNNFATAAECTKMFGVCEVAEAVATRQHRFSYLEFNVPFQHKYGYIRDEIKTDLLRDTHQTAI